MNKITKISNFKNLRYRNALILCDIDDTLLYFPKFSWTTNTLEDWRRHIRENSAVAKEIKGYPSLYKNNHIKLITHRNQDLYSLTEEQLHDLSIPFDELHCISGANKGNYILENINTIEYDQVVFIDNCMLNIRDVFNIYGNFFKYYQKTF